MKKTNRPKIQHFWKIYQSASTRYSSQSMLLHQWDNEVLRKNSGPEIHALTQAYDATLHEHRTIERWDLGAGGRSGQKERIRDILRTQASSKRACQWWYNICKKKGARYCVELGTSLGFSSAAMALSNNETSVYTLEGDPSLVAYAKNLHRNLDLHNTTLMEGEFDHVLPSLIEELPQIDFLLLDGNHDLEPTLRYFYACKRKLHPESIVVVDDVLWSEGMLRAWERLKADEEVTASLLYCGVGFLFFSKDFVVPKHEVWVHPILKPWTLFF